MIVKINTYFFPKENQTIFCFGDGLFEAETDNCGVNVIVFLLRFTVESRERILLICTVVSPASVV